MIDDNIVVPDNNVVPDRNTDGNVVPDRNTDGNMEHLHNNADTIDELKVNTPACLGTFLFQQLKTLVITDDVVEIYKTTFINCPALERVTLPSSIKIFHKEAFSGRAWLKTITIAAAPNQQSQLETIDDHAFSGCTNLQFDFSKHPRLTTIGDNACCGVNFTMVAFPPSLESIGVSAFMECLFLTQVTFPPNSKLVYIKRGAFFNTGIESFHVPRESPN